MNTQSKKPPISPIAPAIPSTPCSTPRWDHFPQPAMGDEKQFSKEIIAETSCVTRTMIQHGYTPVIEYAKTLQGSVWKVHNKHNKLFVIKITQKSLHKKSVASVDGKEIPVKENIIQESAILKYLTWNDPPNSLAKFVQFFHDEFNYYLVAENGGYSLFNFVQKAHKTILNGVLTIQEWQRFCKVAIKQIVDLMEWMHNIMNCCHLDISLENFVISNVQIAIDSNNHMRFLPDFQIKMIDFGLAEVFTKCGQNGLIDFRCCKYVGKTPYKAPKVYARKEIYDPRCADCWSLGIVIFCMITGVFPFSRASKNDVSFQYAMKGCLLELITHFNKGSYFTVSSFDLMSRILKPEKNRIDIGDIHKHSWFAANHLRK